MRQSVPSSNSATSFPDSLPAPTGGWNARDPLAKMGKLDAVFLDNLFPTAGDVQLRKGSMLFATLPADVEPTPHNVTALMSYSAPGGTKKLFAACEDGIYNVTAGGTIGSVDSAATAGKWISTNITTAGGSFLWCCNGVDNSRHYNGTVWTVLSGALTGIVSAAIAHVNSFKFRLVFCCNDSLSFWYLPVNSVAGAASEFPLGPLFTRGGYLMATGSWTLDGGNGPDDYFVAVTSEGEVAVYAGTDPSDATKWALVGVYFIGRPVGRQCLLKLGGDLYVITVQSLYPMSKTLQLSAEASRVPVSDKISKAWTDYTANFKDLFGWQAVFFPEASMLLVNVPILQNHDYAAGLISYQFVMNTQTKSWCRFFGMSAEAWVVHDGNLYFGAHNKVYEAWTGAVDTDSAIDGRGKQAFFRPAGGSNAHVTLVRPILTGGELAVNMSIDTDYNETFLSSGSSTSYGQEVALWDSALWDDAKWSSGAATNAKWRSVSHMPGTAIALRLRINRKGATMSWTNTNLIIQGGGMM